MRLRSLIADETPTFIFALKSISCRTPLSISIFSATIHPKTTFVFLIQLARYRLLDTHHQKFVDNFRKRKALRFDTQIFASKRHD